MYMYMHVYPLFKLLSGQNKEPPTSFIKILCRKQPLTYLLIDYEQ